MNAYLRTFVGLSSAVILTAALGGCATYQKCGIDGCAGDAKLTADVQARFEQHPELGPFGAIEVKTLDHVVYLDGFVATGLERSTAESLAESAPGVTRVVDLIAVSR